MKKPSRFNAFIKDLNAYDYAHAVAVEAQGRNHLASLRGHRFDRYPIFEAKVEQRRIGNGGKRLKDLKRD